MFCLTHTYPFGLLAFPCRYQVSHNVFLWHLMSSTILATHFTNQFAFKKQAVKWKINYTSKGGYGICWKYEKKFLKSSEIGRKVC